MNAVDRQMADEATAVRITMDDIQADPARVYEGGLDQGDALEGIAEEALAVGTDVSSKAARDRIKSMAHKVARTKTAVDNAGKDKTEDMRREISAVNDVRKRFRDTLDGLKAKVRAPLVAWEDQEQARIDSHRAVIEDIVAAGHVPQEETSADIQARIDRVKAIDVSRVALQEYAEQAQTKRDMALGYLTDAYARAVTAEEERAELERLRKEAAEREEKDRQEREAREKAEREEAEAQRKYARDLIEHIRQCGFGFIGGDPYPPTLLMRELNEKISYDEATFGDLLGEATAARDTALQRINDAIAEAERRAQEAEAATARAAEEARLEAERKAEADRQKIIREQEEREERRLAAEREAFEEERRRAADKEHRERIVGEAAHSIMQAAAIGEDRARKIVLAIAAGAVPHVSIKF